MDGVSKFLFWREGRSMVTMSSASVLGFLSILFTTAGSGRRSSLASSGLVQARAGCSKTRLWLTLYKWWHRIIICICFQDSEKKHKEKHNKLSITNWVWYFPSRFAEYFYRGWESFGRRARLWVIFMKKKAEPSSFSAAIRDGCCTAYERSQAIHAREPSIVNIGLVSSADLARPAVRSQFQARFIFWKLSIETGLKKSGQRTHARTRTRTRTRTHQIKS